MVAIGVLAGLLIVGLIIVLFLLWRPGDGEPAPW